VLDGVYAAAPGQEAPAFHPLGNLEDHEVLDPNAKWRARVTSPVKSAEAPPSRKSRRKTPLDEIAARERISRYTWAELLRRVFPHDRDSSVPDRVNRST
jgi:hypothetical protein